MKKSTVIKNPEENILHVNYKDFFININHLPPEGSPEFDSLSEQEEKRCLAGVYVDGIYFSGWLYWHINHWWIRIDDTDKYGNDIRIELQPELRDNEWIRALHLEQCKIQKKGYIEVGGRQSGKSELEASFFAYNAILFKNTQNVMVCGNDADLTLLKDKVDFGLRKLWKGLAIPRLDKTWKGNQIRLGYKTSDGEDEVWSYIVIRNARDGVNTEAAAGTTAKSFVMDEIGKYLFAAAFQAAEPAFKGKNGWRAIPILVATGGSFANGADAENLFYNPESHNFLGIFDKSMQKNIGLFLSGVYRQEGKIWTTLGEWLTKEYGIIVKPGSDLYNIRINVSDKEHTRNLIIQERIAKKTNPDRELYLKQLMYYPLTADECFLSSQENMFDIEGAKRQKQKLISQNHTGTPVELFLNDSGKVSHKISDKLPISNFPLKPSDSKEAPVVIYEFPMENPPYGLYVAGVDSYKSGQAKYSDSLGAVYIYKRMNSLTGEKYQDMFVASYVARPNRKETWEEQARYLIKYYNARTLVENDELSFIDYMVSKGDAHYLEKQPLWLREIVPNTTVNRDYGIHRSASKIISFMHGQMKNYLEEQIVKEVDDNGIIVREVLGVTRIMDPVLLEEIIQFHDDLNVDRLVAAELAIAMANKLDPLYGSIGKTADARILSLGKYKKNKKTTFTNTNRSIFVDRK